MRKNIIQNGVKETTGRTIIPGDWFHNSIPENVSIGEGVFIDSSYEFASFHSEKDHAMQIGKGTGCYNLSTFISCESGKLQIGDFTILNGTTLICQNHISIGNHCMLAWGSVITDSWINSNVTLEEKRKLLINASNNPFRLLTIKDKCPQVIIEDNVWVGFDAIIMPGVKLGRGCIIGCKTVITEDVPPYAVMAGNPARLVRYLKADDTDDLRENALLELIH